MYVVWNWFWSPKMKNRGVIIKKHVFSLSNKCFWILESFESLIHPITFLLCRLLDLYMFFLSATWSNNKNDDDHAVNTLLLFLFQTIGVLLIIRRVRLIICKLSKFKLWNVKSSCTSVDKLSIAELAPGYIGDDIMTTKRLAHYWSFKRGISWSPRYPKDQ